MESAELLHSATTAQIFQEINPNGKITCSRRKPPGMEGNGAIRLLSVVRRQHKYHAALSHGTRRAAALLDKCMRRRQFLLSSGGNMTLTAFYFYQMLYVPRSLAKPFLKLSRPGNKNTRRETGEETRPDRCRLAVTPCARTPSWTSCQRCHASANRFFFGGGSPDAHLSVTSRTLHRFPPPFVLARARNTAYPTSLDAMLRSWQFHY